MAAAPKPPLMPDLDPFLHELTRLRLLVLLSVLKRADFVYILRQSGLSRGNLSVQMTKLAEAGLVEIDKSFVDNRPKTVYALTAAGRKALRAYKSNITTMLDAIPD